MPGNGVRSSPTLGHTLLEWLEDPQDGSLVRAACGVKDNEPPPRPLDDPEVLKLVGGTTMGKFAFFGMGLDKGVSTRFSSRSQEWHWPPQGLHLSTDVIRP
jgi:beta-glucosidase